MNPTNQQRLSVNPTNKKKISVNPTDQQKLSVNPTNQQRLSVKILPIRSVWRSADATNQLCVQYFCRTGLFKQFKI
jgi:hypothetical protein